MNKARKLGSCLIAVVLASPLVQAGTAPTGITLPVTTENFLLRNTADLISLCNAQPNDPNRIAAIHFCQGFILGIRHYDDASEATLQSSLYCHKERSTRNEVVALYVKYHLDNPQYQSESAIDGVIRAAMATWPCPKPADSKHEPATLNAKGRK